VSQAGDVTQNLSTSDMGSRVENRRSDCSLPVAVGLGFRFARRIRGVAVKSFQPETEKETFYCGEWESRLEILAA
jgi:hypothetical protein